MILLLPPEWLTKGDALSDDLGAALHAIFMTAYDEPLSENSKWWPCVKPEGFPWEGEIIDFQSASEKHNQLVAIFHKSDSDNVILNAALALGFESVRSAKLTIKPSTTDGKGVLSAETPEVWYAAIKLSGTDIAVRTIAELAGIVKPSVQSIH